MDRDANVLITGGAGYIGTTLATMLNDLGYNVTILDNLMYGQSQALFGLCQRASKGGGIKFVHADLKEFTSVEKLVSLAKSHGTIIPLACLVGAPLCNENPAAAWRVNYDHIKTLIDEADGAKILYPTTNSGYGIGGVGMVDETSPLNPLSVYGETKVAAEKAVITYGGIAFRLATVFGASPRMRTDLLVNDFVWRAKRDKAIVLFESHFRRNYIHIKDVCQAFLHGIENYGQMQKNIYNVGMSSANLSKLELANKVKDQIPGTVIIESQIGSDPDKRDYLVSNAKLEATGWLPEYTIEDGIEEVSMLYDVVKAGGDTTRNY